MLNLKQKYRCRCHHTTSKTRNNLRVCRIAWSKIASDRIDWRKVLPPWHRCLICETPRSNDVLIRMLPLSFRATLYSSISIPFFHRCSPAAPVSRYMNGAGLKHEGIPWHKDEITSALETPSGWDWKKIEITPVANGSLLNPVRVPTRFRPSTISNLFLSSCGLRERDRNR